MAIGRTVILVLADDTADRLALVGPLEQAGWEVLVVDDSAEAVNIATKRQPALILVDAGAADVDGRHVCTTLREHDQTAAIPLIYAVPLPEIDRIPKALEEGAWDFVTKPFRPEELLTRISTCVARNADDSQQRNLSCLLAEANIELGKLSRVDPLTKLLNRRAWQEVIEQGHERVLRSRCRYSIVMIDVDCFKAFNDTQGY